VDALVHAVDVASDGTGRAIAVWPQTYGGRAEVWTRTFEPVTGWGQPIPLAEVQGVDVSAVRIAASPSAAIVVWPQVADPVSVTWATRFARGVGWGSPQAIDTDDAAFSYVGDVAVAPAGDTAVVWERSVAGYASDEAYRVWANVFR